MTSENTPHQDNEKTTIFNSASERKKENDVDSTKIESPGSGQGSTPKSTAGPASSGASDNGSGGSASTGSDTNTARKESGPSLEDLKKAGTKGEKSFSSGAFAAGVAGAAAAGVAAGTVFSDDIKTAFTATPYDAPESPDEEAHEVTAAEAETETNTPEPVTTPVVEASVSEPLATPEHHDEPSQFTLHHEDQNGVYEVTCTDLDSDGQFDVMTGEAQLVDGNSVSFTASGDVLHEMLYSSEFELAEPEEYIGCCLSGDIEDFGPQCMGGAESYDIAPGDTLSEIAAAHNTTIVEIMDLNPGITDANEIYAGDSILIPSGDNDTNPYAGWSPSPEIDDYPDVQIVEPIPSDEMEPIPTDGGEMEYVEMDWQSFEDQPVEEYNIAMQETDFASMETPESYCDYNNDLDSLDFL